MSPWVELLENGLTFSVEIYASIAISVGVITALFLLRRWMLRAGLKNADPRTQYQWRKTSSYVVYFLIALLLGPIWLSDLRNLATYFGLLSAGLAIALKDPVANLFGWLFIVWRRPFEVGDRVEVGAHAGDVIDLRIFQFTLMEIGNWVEADQSTGRVIHIPNARVFTEPVSNYNKAFNYIWNEIPVPITFESDWQKAKLLLEKVAAAHGADVSGDAEAQVKKAAGRFFLRYAHLTPIVYTSVRENGVLLTIRYLCKPQARRQSAQAVWEAVLLAFQAEAGIEFAYPTQRFYSAAAESKRHKKRSEESLSVMPQESGASPGD